MWKLQTSETSKQFIIKRKKQGRGQKPDLREPKEQEIQKHRGTLYKRPQNKEPGDEQRKGETRNRFRHSGNQQGQDKIKASKCVLR